MFNSCFCRPQEVVIFIIGGTTYEEARTVALQNATNSGTRFILGGSVVLNSKRYVSCHFSFIRAVDYTSLSDNPNIAEVLDH